MRTLAIEIVGDYSQLTKALGGATKETATFGDKVGKLGGTLTKTLTPAAAGVGLAAKKMFDEWDGGYDTIRASTGATGKTLEGLGDSMKRVGGKVTQPLSQVGEAIGEVHKRLGLTGKPLETMTKKFLDLQRLGVDASVQNVSRAFGDWGIKTSQQAATMDKLFRASQITGSSIDELTAAAVKFGSPLRQMGFSLDQTVGMLGKFEKEGVNTNLVMGSMRIALGRIAKESDQARYYQDKVTEAQQKLTKAMKEGDESGISKAEAALEKYGLKLKFAKAAARGGPEAIKAIFDRIRTAKSDTEGTAIALEAFGARAGPDMAAAIREGRFEIGDLMKRIATGKDTIDAAAKDTLDLSDKFQMLKNRVTGVVGPYGEFIALGAGALGSIGPMLLGVGQLSIHLPKVAKAMKGAALTTWAFNVALFANPIGLVVLGLIALGAALFIAWKKSETFREIVTGAWDKVKGVVMPIIDFFITDIPKAFQTVVDKAKEWGAWVKNNILDGIAGLPGEVWDAITGIGAKVAAMVDTVKGWGSSVGGWIKSGVASGITGIVGKVWEYIKAIGADWLAMVDTVKGWGSSLGGWLKDAVVSGVTGLAGKVWDLVNNIWARFLEAVDTIKGWGTSLGTWIKNAIPEAVVGIGSAVWEKVNNIWEFIKEKADVVKGWGKQIGTWIKNAIVGGIKGLGGAVWDAIRDELTSTDKSGFNIIKGLFSGGPKGREPAPSQGPVGSGRLDISPKLWDELALGHRMGLSVSPEGGYRPGDDGDHGKFPSHAIDMVGARMSDFATAMYGRAGIKDVIYGPHPFWQDNGRIISWAGFEQLRRDHAGANAHVHASVFDRGGILAPGINVVANLTGAPEHLVPAMPHSKGGLGGAGNTYQFFFPHYVGDRDELKRAMRSAAQDLERDGTPLVARPVPGFS